MMGGYYVFPHKLRSMRMYIYMCIDVNITFLHLCIMHRDVILFQPSRHVGYAIPTLDMLVAVGSGTDDCVCVAVAVPFVL